MTVIEISDEEAEALRAKASAAGLSLEAWLKQLAGLTPNAEEPPAALPLKTAPDIILDSMRTVPPEIMATMPKDGASQHDHYIYGWPKPVARRNRRDWPKFLGNCSTANGDRRNSWKKPGCR